MLLSQKNCQHSAVLPGDTCVAQLQIFFFFALISFLLSLDGHVTFLEPNCNLKLNFISLNQVYEAYLFRQSTFFEDQRHLCDTVP